MSADPKKGPRSPGRDVVIDVGERAFVIEWKILARCILVQSGVE
jgi:hypothetical protein